MLESSAGAWKLDPLLEDIKNEAELDTQEKKVNKRDFCHLCFLLVKLRDLRDDEVNEEDGIWSGDKVELKRLFD